MTAGSPSGTATAAPAELVAVNRPAPDLPVRVPAAWLPQPAQPTITAPAARIGSHRVRGLAMRVIGAAGGEVGERQRALRRRRAGDQVSAAGIQRCPQRRGHHLQVGDLGLDLGQLGRRPLLQPGVGWFAVIVTARVEQLGDTAPL